MRRALVPVLLVVAACPKTSEGPAEGQAERRLSVLERLPQLDGVADSIDRRLPEPEVAFSSTVAEALRIFEYAQVTRREAPKWTGVVRTDPVTAVFGGGATEASKFLDRMGKIGRPWIFDRLTRDDVIRVDLHGFVFDAGALKSAPPGDALAHRIDEKLAALAKRGYSPERIARLERVGVKQAILGDLDARTALSAPDVALISRTIHESQILPREITLERDRGKKKGTLVFESLERRQAFVAEAARGGAISSPRESELILPSGTVCRLAVIGE